MRIAILSDIHANTEAFRAVLAAIRQQGAERIVCLGDSVGYNAEPAACLSLLQQAGALCVAGNHDRAVTGQISTRGFSPIAARAVEWTRRSLDAESKAYLAAQPLKRVVDGHLVAVHGALHPEEGCELVRLDTDERRAMSFDALALHPSGVRVCAFGHTHQAGIHERHDGQVTRHDDGPVVMRQDGLYLINPGSVGEPRGGDERASFLLFDTEHRTIAVQRVAYDRAAARDKTHRAGLGPRFSRLPAPLRAALVWGVNRLGLSDSVRRRIYARPG